MNSAFEPQRFDHLRAAMERYVERGAVPGLSYVVSRRGDAQARAIGTLEVAGDRPIQEDSIFWISSMTKPVTAVATLILVEEGILRLEDSVEGFLGEFVDRRVVRRMDGPVDDTVPALRAITVLDLLTFTMGFGGYFGPCPINDVAASLQLGVGPPQPRLPPEPVEWRRQLSTLPLMFQPGERWLYHTGSDVLGVLVARASGQSFETFLRERDFEPLAMPDKGFAVPSIGLSRFTTCYSTDPGDGGLEVYDTSESQWSSPPDFPSGGAGLVSTARDYLSFASMLLRGGAPLLARSTVETMTSDHLAPGQKAVSGFFPHDFDARGWGLGVAVVTRTDSPSAPIGQYGWNGGLGTVWVNDPTEQLSAVLLTNAMWSSPRPPAIVQDLLAGVYAAIAA